MKKLWKTEKQVFSVLLTSLMLEVIKQVVFKVHNIAWILVVKKWITSTTTTTKIVKNKGVYIFDKKKKPNSYFLEIVWKKNKLNKLKTL